jgi:hypothetical protein
MLTKQFPVTENEIPATGNPEVAIQEQRGYEMQEI